MGIPGAGALKNLLGQGGHHEEVVEEHQETGEVEGHPVEVDEKLVKVQDVKETEGPQQGGQSSGNAAGSGTSVEQSSRQGQSSRNIGSGSQSGEGKSAALDAAQGERTQFNEGYRQGKPGYDGQFDSSDTQYKEETFDDGDVTTTKITASGGHKEWMRARAMTEAADKESAQAEIYGKKAARELAASEKAQLAVDKAQEKHREALREAEQYRDQINDPKLSGEGVQQARELYEQKQAAAKESESALREAEEDLAAKKRDADSVHPQVEQQGQKLPELEQEYERLQREREGVEGEKDRAQAEAGEVDESRSARINELKGLQEELNDLEVRVEAKLREYTEIRDLAKNKGDQIDRLKAMLKDHKALDATRSRAKEANSKLPSLREAEERALEELKAAKDELNRLRERELQLTSAFKDASDRVDSLRNSNAGKNDLEDAQNQLQTQEGELEQARGRSQEAEAKYNELQALADKHAQYGDSAAAAAAGHRDRAQDAEKEAKIHGDKHVEYWNEAKGAGGKGSSKASAAVRELEQKVQEQLANEA